jgi:hypothetical protein
LKWRFVMSTRKPAAIGDGRGEQADRYEEEKHWLLHAIAGAIAAGKLPPDDAAAWARIAACEVEALLASDDRAA